MQNWLILTLQKISRAKQSPFGTSSSEACGRGMIAHIILNSRAIGAYGKHSLLAVCGLKQPGSWLW